MNSIGQGTLRARSGRLVQRSQEFAALQQRRAAQHRHVHLTVISCQLGQQVGFKGGPQQATGHTCNTAGELSYGAETRKDTCFLPPLLFTPGSFCFYVNIPQTTSSSRCQSKPVLCPSLNCCKGVTQTSAVFPLHPQI